jgi:cation diffusion facilitator family transporter
MIIYEAIHKLFKPVPVEQAAVAIGVMFISAVINWFVSRKLYKVALEEDSMALEADALHLKTDVFTSLGVGFGILLIKITHLDILDPIAAILVALLIIKEAGELTKNAFDHLLDIRLSDAEEAEIRRLIETFSDEFRDYHKLKTRKSGKMKHIDFHLTLDPEMTVRESHDLIGRIKKEMSEKIRNTRVIVHIDPFKD